MSGHTAPQANFSRKVISRTRFSGPRGGKWVEMVLECGHALQRPDTRIYPSREERCSRCEHPEWYIRDLGLSPTHEAALARLYREKQIRRVDVIGAELRALMALVPKGFAVEVFQPHGNAHFKLPE